MAVRVTSTPCVCEDAAELPGEQHIIVDHQKLHIA